ncbi:helix-turn-helix transcriptional regulator [Actinoallomurus iriomotensis]|uniref:helix-turn-helix transcriptional regulator n=1 Tax=Actinoallomurus iriomotensis TaxID=478107 RepID=UPI00255458AA|nr:LuxR family transcriptional regulator [Actinoallomurus iriomotensis]
MTEAIGVVRGRAGPQVAGPVGELSAHALVGRGPLLEAARAQLAAGSVLLTGPAGIGKSTLLSALAAEVTGHRILRCSLSQTEHHLPFLGLIDLLADTGDEILHTLPAPQRAALESALLRHTDPVGERDGLSLRMAVLATFRALCASGPVLIVVDDAQWLDAPSAELLAFIARRARGLPLRALVGQRTGAGGSRPEPRLCPPPVRAFDVPPMTAAEVTRLLGELELPRAVLAKVHRASGGNPFFAVELGRALAEHDGPLDPAAPLPVPDGLRSLMLGRLLALSSGARRTLLTACAAARPTLALLRGAGRPDADADLAEAREAGIVAPGEVVRFTHPLLAAVLYAEAPERDRLAVHAALADVVTDPVERARHLALVAPGRDAEVAATLDEAAAAARRRGAPAAAARLGLLAADRTPRADEETGLRLTAAEDALASGEFALARGIAEEVLAHASIPAERVRAWIVLLDSGGQALAELDDVFPRALADARDDPALLAPLRYRLAWRAWLVKGSAPRARDEAATAARLAAEAGDRRTEVLALTKQALAEFHTGRLEAERTLERALSGPQDPAIRFDHNGPVYLRHRHHLLHDRLEEARAELRSLTYAVRQRGAVEDLFMCLYGSAQVEIFRGRCDRALDLAEQCLRLAEDSELSRGPAWCAVAFAEAAGGALDRALAAAERAVAHSEDDGDLLFLPHSLHAAGHIRLLRGDAAGAADALRRVRRLERGQGLVEPAMRRWHADLAEALVATGASGEAAEVIEETRRDAVRLGRRGVLAVLERASALVTAARGDLDGAVEGLTRAVETLAASPYPLEEGRARLELGRLRVRMDAPAPARESLRAAHRVFTRAKAAPWVAAVTAELDHLDVGAPRPTAEADALHTLTGVERRVAMLVADGATNREIATRLFVSVKTVEAALTRTYRKLGIRSRVDLARLAAAHRTGDRPA